MTLIELSILYLVSNRMQFRFLFLFVCLKNATGVKRQFKDIKKLISN